MFGMDVLSVRGDQLLMRHCQVLDIAFFEVRIWKRDQHAFFNRGAACHSRDLAPSQFPHHLQCNIYIPVRCYYCA